MHPRFYRCYYIITSVVIVTTMLLLFHITGYYFITGGYDCLCHPGYTGAGPCIDFDECVPDPCHPNAECINTEGAYRCECKTGFWGSGVVCQDVNECLSLQGRNPFGH